MFHKAIDILKLRKSDVIKVVSIMIFCSLLDSIVELSSDGLRLEDGAFLKFIASLIRILLFAIPAIFSLGLERLIVFFPNSRTSLWECFKTGYKYFWRTFWFLAILVVVCIVLSLLIVNVFQRVLNLETIDSVYYSILISLMFLVFVKYLYFVPAQIIVYDRSIVKAVLNVNNFRTNETKRLILFCFIWQLFVMIISNLRLLFMVRHSIPYETSMVFQTIITTPVFFFLGLVVVLHVHRQFCFECPDLPKILD